MAKLTDIVKQSTKPEPYKEPKEKIVDSTPTLETSCPHCGGRVAFNLVALPTITRLLPKDVNPKDLDHSVEELGDEIREMLDSGDYNWASDTLTSIYDQITQKHYFTEKQKQAVHNIRDSRNRRRGY